MGISLMIYISQDLFGSILPQWSIQIYNFHNDLSRSITSTMIYPDLSLPQLSMIYQGRNFNNDLLLNYRAGKGDLSPSQWSIQIYHFHNEQSITLTKKKRSIKLSQWRIYHSHNDLRIYHFHNDLSRSITLTMIYSDVSLPQWSIQIYHFHAEHSAFATWTGCVCVFEEGVGMTGFPQYECHFINLKDINKNDSISKRYVFLLCVLISCFIFFLIIFSLCLYSQCLRRTIVA